MFVMKMKAMIGVAAIGAAAFLVIGAGAVPAAKSRRTATPAAAPAPPPAARLAAFGDVRPGLWTIDGDGPGATPRRLCIEDAAGLIQAAHPGAACSRIVIADDAHRATVQYRCPGAGWGRTSLRMDGAGTIVIDTQGIAGNAPFAWRAAAHRAGAC